jgi:hypothetical protein
MKFQKQGKQAAGGMKGEQQPGHLHTRPGQQVAAGTKASPKIARRPAKTAP